MCVFKEQRHIGPLGIQLNHLEAFVVIRYFSSAVPSQLPKSYCSAVCCNSPCSSCCSNVNARFPALRLLQVYGSFLPLLDYDSSIWEMPSETSSACVCHPTPTPKKATTPALCIQWTLNEHLLIADIAKYQADRRWINLDSVLKNGSVLWRKQTLRQVITRKYDKDS